MCEVCCELSIQQPGLAKAFDMPEGGEIFAEPLGGGLGLLALGLLLLFLRRGLFRGRGSVEDLLVGFLGRDEGVLEEVGVCDIVSI